MPVALDVNVLGLRANVLLAVVVGFIARKRGRRFWPWFVVGFLVSMVAPVSVAIEEVKPQDWAEKVYKPDIVNSSEKLYKKPGYKM